MPTGSAPGGGGVTERSSAVQVEAAVSGSRALPGRRFGFGELRLSDLYLLAIILLFLLADLPQAIGLTDRDNQLFILFVPILLLLSGSYLVLTKKVYVNYTLLFIVAVSAILYLASFFLPVFEHQAARPFRGQWLVAKTGFMVNLLLIYSAYVLARKNDASTNRVILRRFGSVCFYVIVVAFAVYLLHNLYPFLPDRVISYGGADFRLFGTRWTRFGATLKEPSEFAFLCTFLVGYFLYLGERVKAGVMVFVSLFVFSNFLYVGYLFLGLMLLALRFARPAIVPGLLAAYASAGVALYFLGPGSEFFHFIEYIVPRSGNLLSVREDSPQRLWGNVIAVREFMEFAWPLGGNAGYVRAFTRDFYFYSVYVLHAPGAGIFRFLMDFGLFAIPILAVLSYQLHARVVMTGRGDALARVLILLCVFYLSLRTGYQNVSVWALLIMLYFGYLKMDTVRLNSESRDAYAR